MTFKTSSERLADAMERTRRQWREQIKAKAPPVPPKPDPFLAALREVEHLRQRVDEKVQALGNALRCLGETGMRQPRQVIGVFQDLSDFFATRLAPLLQTEEQTLFPFLEESSPDGGARVAGLRQDHAAILDKRQEFADHLQKGAALIEKGGLTREILLKILASGLELWELLDANMQSQTEIIHQCKACRVPRDQP
jgi:hypothetical protein